MALKKVKAFQQIKIFNADTVGVEEAFNLWMRNQKDTVIADIKIAGTGSDMILTVLYTKTTEWIDHTIDDLYKIIEGH